MNIIFTREETLLMLSVPKCHCAALKEPGQAFCHSCENRLPIQLRKSLQLHVQHAASEYPSAILPELMSGAVAFLEQSRAHDPVTRPAHYLTGRIEVLDFILDQKLDFCLGAAVKYIARAAHKGNELEDLRKAHEVLDRRIRSMEGASCE